MIIYKHYEGYGDAVEKVNKQAIDEDLSLIDGLFGRDNIEDESNEDEVKQECLRQVEIDWRKCVDEDVTFWVNVIQAQIAKED